MDRGTDNSLPALTAAFLTFLLSPEPFWVEATTIFDGFARIAALTRAR
jgi:hypothetical protein